MVQRVTRRPVLCAFWVPSNIYLSKDFDIKMENLLSFYLKW